VPTFESSWTDRESILTRPYEAELLVLERWSEFHRKALGFMPSWGSYAC
jgi:hypothetical protein